jgi:hypothetical protein
MFVCPERDGLCESSLGVRNGHHSGDSAEIDICEAEAEPTCQFRE